MPQQGHTFNEQSVRRISETVQRSERQARNTPRPMRPQRNTPRFDGILWHRVVVLLQDLNEGEHAQAQIVCDGDPSSGSGSTGSSGSQGECCPEDGTLTIYERWGCANAGDTIGVLWNPDSWDATFDNGDGTFGRCGRYEGALQKCADCDTSSSSAGSASTSADCTASQCEWVWVQGSLVPPVASHWSGPLDACPTGCSCSEPAGSGSYPGEVGYGQCLGPSVGVTPPDGETPPINVDSTGIEFGATGSNLGTTSLTLTFTGTDASRFQFSPDGTTGWATTLDLTPTAGEVAASFWVRKNPLEPDPITSYEATIQASSGIATPATCDITYAVIPP